MKILIGEDFGGTVSSPTMYDVVGARRNPYPLYTITF